MQVNFDKVMPYVHSEEGGYVNHPKDPGKATNMGITQATLSAWIGRPATIADVKSLSKETANKIYRSEYWNKISGDKLPSGIDYAVLDFAINSGVARASKYLQQVLGVGVDGIIGAKTIAAAAKADAKKVINALCDARQKFVEGLDNWKTFGKGWTDRIKRVRARALQLAAAKEMPIHSEVLEDRPPTTPKAEQTSTSVETILKKPEAALPIIGAAGSFIASVFGAVTDNPILSATVGIAFLALVGTGVWYFVQRVRSDG